MKIFGKIAVLSGLMATLGACGHVYTDVKEIKMIAFSDDVSKGKSSGQIKADDCVFKVLGYSLGDWPDISTAIGNARVAKKSQVTDVVASSENKGPTLRYVNNVVVKNTGFDAYVFGKTCLEVTGMGYL